MANDVVKFKYLDIDAAEGVEPSREDVALVGRALKQGWGLSQEDRDVILTKLMTIVAEGKDRSAISAASAILAAQRVDIETSKLELEKQKAGQTNSDSILDLSMRIETRRPHDES
jgi:hypothetical protein